MALIDVEVLQASLATCSLKRASYLFMYPSEVGSGVQLLGVTSPWGLGRGIHAADTPATGPTPPSTVSCHLSERRIALVGVDLGRHGKSTPCVDAFRFQFEIFDSD
ncbi:hypothetical protein, partial [Stenotrophomonas sepilia]|uniref:hypothetical protein n=1 Tax=Stenotrophomonas sepilia TaxID=2860290 RepID=UPI002E7743C3